MLRTAIICAFLSLSFNLFSQNSYFGENATAKGHFHGLFLIISQDCPYPSSELAAWPYDSLPDWAKGDYNDIIDLDTNQIGTVRNLTDYYNVMSGGDFLFTGKILQVHVPCDTFASGNPAVFKARAMIDWQDNPVPLREAPFSQSEISSATFSLSPNPVENQVIISWFREAALWQLEVVNLRGEKQGVSIRSEAEDQLELDLSELSSGMYLVRILFEDGASDSRMLIKQ